VWVIDGLDALVQGDVRQLEGDLRYSVVSVGVFDGVHLGHQRLLHELVEMGSELRAAPTVVTFKDHPDLLLRGAAPPLIISVPHRLRLLRRAGVDRVLLLDFSPRVRELSAIAFTREILVAGLRCRGLLLGFDSALGKDREGTPGLMRRLGEQHGFVVREAQAFTVDGERPSSTKIREALAKGDLGQCHRLLGRWPSLFGTVERGAGRGKTLGYPTANLVPQSLVLPPLGVYAARVILDGETLPAVANLGTHPTFGGADRPLLEIHLLDWNGELYGRSLEACFVRFLRPERKFQSEQELTAQVEQDVARAREVLHG
jgi:riboflavin kinase/FMN adenylyltransferase